MYYSKILERFFRKQWSTLADLSYKPPVWGQDWKILSHSCLKNGLDWLPGQVRKLEVDSTSYKIPHMGWNTIDVLKSHKVLEGLDGESVYFVHSYAFRPDDLSNCLATTAHGASFASVVGHNNVIGTQFHPEKSQHVGLRLIKNFLEWRP